MSASPRNDDATNPAPRYASAGRRREPAGDDRPPEEQSAGDEHAVLDVQRPAGVERPVVEAGEMRRVPGDEPRGQRVARADVPRAVAVEPRAHRRREPEQDEQRRDVGDQRVLQEVDEQQPLGRDRLERRVERRGDEEDARARSTKRASGTAGRARAPRRTRRPPRRRARGTPTRTRSRSALTRCTSRGVTTGRSRKNTSTPSVSSCSAIITTPASCWSVAPRSRTRRGRSDRAGGSEDEHVGEHLAAANIAAASATRPPTVSRWCEPGSMRSVHTRRPASTQHACSKSCSYGCRSARS